MNTRSKIPVALMAAATMMALSAGCASTPWVVVEKLDGPLVVRNTSFTRVERATPMIRPTIPAGVYVPVHPQPIPRTYRQRRPRTTYRCAICGARYYSYPCYCR